MADITINGVTGNLVLGTTGDDEVTFDVAVAGSGNGNGGADTGVLNGNASIVGTTAYNATTDTWSLGGGTLIGFDTLTFSDGVVLEAGVASSGIKGVSGLDTVALNTTGASSYAWDGAALALGPVFTPISVVSVDGVAVASAGNTFTNADGAFVVSGTSVTFTGDADAISAQGNVGDTATFTYDVVVADGTGATQTVPLTWTATIAFTPNADTYLGTLGNDSKNGLAGDDVMSGNDGDDTLDGGAGNDMVMGEAGNDSLIGGAGDDTLDGGAGNDDLDESSDTGATAGNNVLRGGTGTDTVTGGDGDDVLRGEQDDDTVVGGAGDDSLAGGSGNDSLDGGAGDDVIQGGVGNDTIETGAGGDTVRAGDGDDSITASGGGDNELRGGDGNDTVVGGSGRDMIFTSLGDADVMTGGLGTDTFIIKDGTGNTTLTDFDVTTDKLDFTGVASISSLADVQAAAYETVGEVVIQLDDGNSLILNTQGTLTTLADLDGADFIF